MIGVAAYQGYRAATKDFLKDSKTEEMSPKVRDLVEWIGVVGHLARMIVFGLVGVFLIKTAVEYNPSAPLGWMAPCGNLPLKRTGQFCSASSQPA